MKLHFKTSLNNNDEDELVVQRMADMRIERLAFAVCALNNHIYVAGGIHLRTAINSTDRYNILLDKWE